MKVDTMRKIDRWAGVPLCFLLSLWFKLWQLLFKPKAVPAKNVLFLELSEMGSAIIADPALRYVKEQEGAQVFFAIFKKNVGSLHLLNTIDEKNLFTFCEDNLFTLVVDTFRFMLWCRKNKIDTVVDMEMFSRVSALLSRISGAVNLIGFVAYHSEGLYRGNFLTRPVVYNAHHHIAKNFMALSHTAMSQEEQLPFCKSLIKDEDIVLAQAPRDESAIARVHATLTALYGDYRVGQRVVLINPNASDLLPQRRWPAEHFKVVIDNLLARYDDILVVITGAPAEFPGAQALCQSVANSRCVNSAGKFAFKDLVPLYFVADMMLTNDSGPGHFSAVTPLRSFVIFGPETPALYSSLGNSSALYLGLACSPCVSAANHRKTDCVDNRCVKDLLPELALADIYPHLDKIVSAQ
ncbi:glycosyltransferase family 9 protein [Simiduia curdlanivorans]|uniref:Glycosyltransferase family 9 protein n=1 Tax=Simiduia curdlanivorans TaxID=1492769 RepID=A0ABV8V4R4_9GAMM|nr:glycosyltransferase family 9 protein [Simiduia curdlanivorans]MDN3640548.1 glycosyltransferase family 9 protein [Simiduia curdlanivorans]